jgi:tRNA A-37 threonylcarbamoyl transferase component Bud32
MEQRAAVDATGGDSASDEQGARLTTSSIAPTSPVVRIERSPADVLRLVVAAGVLVVAIAVEWLAGDDIVAFASDLFRGIDAVPEWLVGVIVHGIRALAVIVLGGVLVLALSGHRRWRMLVTVVLAAVSAALLSTVVGGLLDSDAGTTLVDVDGDAVTGFVATTQSIAVLSAALTAAGPWLGRGLRRAGSVLVVAMVVVGLVDDPVSFGPLGAVIVGWFAGTGVLVALGAPSRRPTPAAVASGLASVGLAVRQLEPAGVDARGSTPYFGESVDGGALFVKVLGVDERSADLLFRLYRTLQHKSFGDERPFSSLRRSVEHEAFVALAATSFGVRSPRLRAFAAAEPNGYVLAYDAIAGRSLDRLDPAEVTDTVLDASWRLVGELRRHRVAHRDLRLANIFLDDGGEVWLIDFGFSEMAASDVLLATDVAELIASSSLSVGAERAVRGASVCDPATLARALPRLQRWALSGATRVALANRPGQLDELRARLAAVVASTEPAAVR